MMSITWPSQRSKSLPVNSLNTAASQVISPQPVGSPQFSTTQKSVVVAVSVLGFLYVAGRAFLRKPASKSPPAAPPSSSEKLAKPLSANGNKEGASAEISTSGSTNLQLVETRGSSSQGDFYRLCYLYKKSLEISRVISSLWRANIEIPGPRKQSPPTEKVRKINDADSVLASPCVADSKVPVLQLSINSQESDALFTYRVLQGLLSHKDTFNQRKWLEDQLKGMEKRWNWTTKDGASNLNTYRVQKEGEVDKDYIDYLRKSLVNGSSFLVTKGALTIDEKGDRKWKK